MGKQKAHEETGIKKLPFTDRMSLHHLHEGTPDFYQQYSERQRISLCKESLENSNKAHPFHGESNGFMESNYTFRPKSRHYNNALNQQSQSVAFTLNSDYQSIDGQS